MGEEVDEPGWEVDPEDEAGAAVVATVGKMMRWHRKRAGLSALEFGRAMRYSEDYVYKLEAGTRIPRAEHLDRADKALRANGAIAALKPDVAEVRYPKKVRQLAKLEARAVELLSYGSHNLHGLLQTEQYARAVLRTRRPTLSPDQLERAVSGRIGRQVIFERTPAPELSFVLEEMTLRRPVGGREIWHRQLERLLEIGKLPNVDIQVMPVDRWDHPGTDGRIQVLKFGDGSSVGRADDENGGRPVSHPRQLRILELRYGIIRAQALTPRESLAFIEQMLGET
ncbi:helix-turn-helix transcriptional regulator [Streptomyces sp. NPDC046887]|uniref:helix-turn-helix domain-containing protein n=1 Tax=Streptomyces sp. NPDC046887 TaxID=3155472 RepID=UPI0033C49C2F